MEIVSHFNDNLKQIIADDINKVKPNLVIDVGCGNFWSKGLVNNVVGFDQSKWGRIVYIGSSSSYAGYKNTSAYCASKHGILGFGRAIQEEVKEKNVRVYTFSPGSIKTKMGKKIKEQNYETFMEPNEIADFIVYTISFDSIINSRNTVNEI